MSAAPREGSGGVEFLGEFAAAPDEPASDELSAPEPIVRPWHLATAGVLAASLLAAAVLDGTATRHRAAPSTPPPTPAVSSVARPGPPLTGELFACWAARECSAQSEESPPVARAVSAGLPGALISSDVVLTSWSGRLRARQVNGVAGGGVLVVVRVLPAGVVSLDPVVLNEIVGDHRVGYVRTEVLGDFQVQVQLTGPTQWDPPIEGMQALARDPRLLAAPAPVVGARATVWG